MAACRRRRRVSDGDGDGAGSTPSLSDGLRAGMDRNRRLILGCIYGYYKEAVDAMPLDRMPALGPRLLESGVCFGFGDPVTNIIANTLSFVPARGEPLPEPDGAGNRRWKRKKGSMDARARGEILSNIVAGDTPSPPEARTIAERSLEGLVTFLVSYFRYLPTWDALRYLCLCRADLLAAVHLIEQDRCQHKFSVGSHATKTALRCAALSVRLSNVHAFLTGSFALLSLLARKMPAESFHRRLSVPDVTRLSGLLKEPLELKRPSVIYHLAAIRCQEYEMKVPPVLKESVQAILLDRIHAVYLKAITLIPVEDFCSRYHRGFLRAGYCYGPFSPLFNIIVNTVWYDTAFPAPQAIKLNMLCTQILIRVESRSLDGLINLLIGCISGLSEHGAMLYLLKSDLDLSRAVQMARQDGYETYGWDAHTYASAAVASWHPEHEAYLHFLMESLPRVESAVIELLTAQILSSDKILQLSMLLSSSSSHFSKLLKPTDELTEEPTDELTEDALSIASSYKEKFFSQQNFISKKVEAILLNFEQTKEKYELRFICSVNENVGSKSFRDLKYPYSHVNFLASPKGSTCLTLFFAQVSNNDKDSEHHRSFCQPVSIRSTSEVRCCYCEFEGTRIVHPIESYCGSFMDFEKMATGSHTMTNARVISHGKLIACRVGILGEEYIYFDPARDAKFIRAMNQTAWEADLNWGDEIRRVKQTGVV